MSMRTAVCWGCGDAYNPDHPGLARRLCARCTPISPERIRGRGRTIRHLKGADNLQEDGGWDNAVRRYEDRR